MISFSEKGSFKKTEEFLRGASHTDLERILDRYGKKGVAALKKATPENTGKTADSWEYSIERGKGSISLVFSNTNVQNGVPVVVLIRYGHATKNGGFVQGRDFISPVTAPIFDKIAKEAWKEVRNK